MLAILSGCLTEFIQIIMKQKSLWKFSLLLKPTNTKKWISIDNYNNIQYKAENKTTTDWVHDLCDQDQSPAFFP